MQELKNFLLELWVTELNTSSTEGFRNLHISDVMKFDAWVVANLGCTWALSFWESWRNFLLLSLRHPTLADLVSADSFFNFAAERFSTSISGILATTDIHRPKGYLCTHWRVGQVPLIPEFFLYWRQPTWQNIVYRLWYFLDHFRLDKNIRTG